MTFLTGCARNGNNRMVQVPRTSVPGFTTMPASSALIMIFIAVIGITVSFSNVIEELTYMDLDFNTPDFDYGIADGKEDGNTMFDVYVITKYIALGLFETVLIFTCISKAIKGTETRVVQPRIVNRIPKPHFNPLQKRFEDLLSKEVPKTEDEYTEFKEFYQYDAAIEKLQDVPTEKRNNIIKSKKQDSQERVAAAICAMGNKDGGCVYIGIRSDGTVVGLDKDMEFGGFANHEDSLANHIEDKLKELIRDHPFMLTRLKIGFREAEGKTMCMILIMPSNLPLFLYGSRGTKFYVRGASPRSESLEGTAQARYIAERFRGNV